MRFTWGLQATFAIVALLRCLFSEQVSLFRACWECAPFSTPTCGNEQHRSDEQHTVQGPWTGTLMTETCRSGTPMCRMITTIGWTEGEHPFARMTLTHCKSPMIPRVLSNLSSDYTRGEQRIMRRKVLELSHLGGLLGRKRLPPMGFSLLEPRLSSQHHGRAGR